MIDFFKVGTKLSMMRLLSFICVICACVIALAGIIKGLDLNQLAFICGIFLGTGIGGKYMQTKTEGKTNEDK